MLNFAAKSAYKSPLYSTFTMLQHSYTMTKNSEHSSPSSLEAPVLISISKLEGHPDNPRRVYRNQTIEEIANQLGEHFPVHHAITVRPLPNDKYQIVSGHNRKDAAERVGLKQIPAYVRDLDDQQAYMELVLSNLQSELYPLERGLHALGAIEKGKHRLGISAYAKRVGRPEPSVNQEVRAARVATSCSSVNISELIHRAKHLSAIHATPSECWEPLVKRMLAAKWTVQDTEAAVSRVMDVTAPAGYSQYFDLSRLQILHAEDADADGRVAKMIDALHDAETLVRDRHGAQELQRRLKGVLPCDPAQIIDSAKELLSVASAPGESEPAENRGDEAPDSDTTVPSPPESEPVRDNSSNLRSTPLRRRGRNAKRKCPRAIKVPTDPEGLADKVIALLGRSKAEEIAQAILRKLHP
jgi:ParB/RepB/Spo0J family partition protein